MEPSSECAAESLTTTVAPTRHLPPPRSSDGAPATAPDTGPRWSPAAAVALTATAVLLAGALVTHLAMIFLTLAPANALRATHGKAIDSYVQPEFAQDWKLFAPNPKQRNDAIGVRLRTGGTDRAVRTSDWINLTAQDVAEIQGNPAPSHVHQNMLRIAWDNSEAWLDAGNRPRGIRGKVAVDYLRRIALQRVGRDWQGERITGMQLAGRYTMVQPPSWSSEDAPDTTTYRMLPWWPVTDQDYRGL
ncbi:DUF5819 family protein [Streptomyces sp. NPDC015661]|uniref:DUF5819 family protein n=1 Tax=Streptomyces sp. NPDC015661 TaxID=3364961 RepID=UPI003702820D